MHSIAIMNNPIRYQKLGALLGPLAWDNVSQEESRNRTEVGKSHSSMPEM